MAPTGSPPPTTPDGLPVSAIPSGNAVYGVFFAPWSSHSTLYAVGPRGASCGVGVGTGFVWSIEEPTGLAFSYQESWSADPPMWMGCPYLESARRIYLDYLAGSGQAVTSATCAPDPGDEIVPVPSPGTGLELALVWAGPPKETGPTLRLPGYRGGDAPGGFGFIARCPLDPSRVARCRAALAFVAWSVGAGTTAVSAILDDSATPASQP